MGSVALMLFIMLLAGAAQAWLSFRRNHHYGLIIPGLNLVVATLLGMMCSDYFVGYFIYFVVVIPLILWIGIYFICRRSYDQRVQNEVNKSRIKDL